MTTVAGEGPDGAGAEAARAHDDLIAVQVAHVVGDRLRHVTDFDARRVRDARLVEPGAGGFQGRFA